MSFEEVVEKYNQLNEKEKEQVNNLLNKLVAQNEKTNKKQTTSVFGALKGKIKMSPDFDEPLDDFKDYM